MTTLEILKRARGLVEKGWHQGAFYADGPDHRAFCAEGAILWAADTDPGEYRNDAFWARCELEKVIGNRVVSEWNDKPGRTQAEVLAAFDKAIEAERSRSEKGAAK